MKYTMATLGAVMAWTSPAIAAGNAEPTGIGLLTVLLLGFGALIVVGQLIPGLIIFCGIVKDLFGDRTIKARYRYYPTCAEYAVAAIRRRGSLKGLVFFARRILG